MQVYGLIRVQNVIRYKFHGMKSASLGVANFGVGNIRQIATLYLIF
jgi:hypothetical protein